MRTRFLFAVTVAVASFIATPLLAEAWVAKMFEKHEHNFGTVARGADTVHRFPAKNIYKQDVELVSVRSSCGCTTPSIEKKVLKTNEVGYVTATFNTRTFTGLHGATLTVEVRWHDNGRWRRGETQLRVNGNIRGDVVFKPGAIRFDSIEQGKLSEQKVEVAYAGRSDWKIVDVRGASNHLEVEMTQKQRASSRATYDLLVRLKDSAPAGYFNEQLVLVTNDEQNPRIPIHISGRVVPAISVAPEPLLLGNVVHGTQVSKKVLVRAKQPFRIVSVQCSDEECFQFKAGQEASERHVVEIIFTAKKNPGAVKQTIHVATDLGEDLQATLTAYANVVPPAADSPANDPTAAAVPLEAGTASAAGARAGAGIDQ
jgi:Protein of unknown function (DUF1573)